MSMRRVHLALALAVLAVSGCATFRDALAPPPPAKPSGRAGWVAYALRDLTVEVPQTWAASGGERKMTLAAPDGKATLEVSYPGQGFPDERACLAAADEKLAQQQGTLARARRHPTRIAGRSGHALEGDQGGWHVWAWAVCDGGVQYRVFFTAASPASPEAIEVSRAVVSSARLGGEA
jgi:hypothetical protein